MLSSDGLVVNPIPYWYTRCRMLRPGAYVASSGLKCKDRTLKPIAHHSWSAMRQLPVPEMHLTGRHNLTAFVAVILRFTCLCTMTSSSPWCQCEDRVKKPRLCAGSPRIRAGRESQGPPRGHAPGTCMITCCILR